MAIIWLLALMSESVWPGPLDRVCCAADAPGKPATGAPNICFKCLRSNYTATQPSTCTNGMSAERIELLEPTAPCVYMKAAFNLCGATATGVQLKSQSVIATAAYSYSYKLQV